jgi:hypothetical protein
MSGCRSLASSGAVAPSPTAGPHGARPASRAGVALELLATAPAGVAARASSGAPLAVPVAALAGARLLSLSGANQDAVQVITAAPSGARSLARSGAASAAATSATSSVSGSRLLGFSGASGDSNDATFVRVGRFETVRFLPPSDTVKFR